MTSPLGLSTYRWNNNIKSMLLMAAFPCLLLGLVALFFYILGFMNTTPQGFVHPSYVGSFVHNAPTQLTILNYTILATKSLAPYVFGVAIVWMIIGSLFNQSLIRIAASAKTVSRSDAPELYNLLETLCISRGLTMPKLFIMETPVMNAFASGMGPSSYAITVTRGLMDNLAKDEMEAVLAHELSHIMNRDVRLMVVVVLFIGMLSFFAEMSFRSIRFSSSGSNNRSKGSGAIVLIAAIVLLIGYLISTLFRLALSRRREYLADAGAVALTKRPEAMIRALEKIAGHASLQNVPSGVQAMMIENPPGLFDIFDTHPPIEARIAVLRQLGGIPDEGESIIPRTKA